MANDQWPYLKRIDKICEKKQNKQQQQKQTNKTKEEFTMLK